MRDIKFRAYDREAREMMTADLFDAFYYEEGSILDEILLGHEEPDHAYRGLANYALMQYTGLKDKNGAEIYEGDVLRSDEWVTAARVSFYNGSFCAEHLVPGMSESYVGMRYILSASRTSTLEVMGDIYQSPELLEKVS